MDFWVSSKERKQKGADRERKGEINPIRPRNTNLVQGVEAITEVGLPTPWSSLSDKFPAVDGTTVWEVWLEPEFAESFVGGALDHDVAVGGEKPVFPAYIVASEHADCN